MSNKCHFKYNNRSASNQSDKGIAWMYTNGSGSFDTSLIATDGRKVMAHAYALSLFSKYFEDKLDEAVGFTFEIRLPNMSYEIIQKIVELFYFREVFVPIDLKEKMVGALHFLQVDDDDINVLQQEKQLNNQNKSANPTGPNPSPQKITQRRPTAVQSQDPPAVVQKITQRQKATVPLQGAAGIRKPGPSTSANVAPPVTMASGSRPNVGKIQTAAATVNLMGKNLSQLTITKSVKPKDASGAKAPSLAPNQSQVNKAAVIRLPVGMTMTKLPSKIVQKPPIASALKTGGKVATPDGSNNKSEVVEMTVPAEKETVTEENNASAIDTPVRDLRDIFPMLRDPFDTEN